VPLELKRISPNYRENFSRGRISIAVRGGTLLIATIKELTIKGFSHSLRELLVGYKNISVLGPVTVQG
jgi:hypothetical protein